MSIHTSTLFYPSILRGLNILTALLLGILGTSLILSILAESIIWHFVLVGFTALIIAVYAIAPILENLMQPKLTVYLILSIFLGIFLLFLMEESVLILNELPLNLLWIDLEYVNKIFFEQSAMYYIFVLSILYLAVSIIIRKKSRHTILCIKNKSIKSFFPLVIIGFICFLISIFITKYINGYESIIALFTLVSLSFFLVGVMGTLLMFLTRKMYSRP